MVAPGFAAVLPGSELPGIHVEGLDGQRDWLLIDAAQQFGHELHLPLAGHVGADLARLVDRRSQLPVQWNLGQAGRADADEFCRQRSGFQGFAAPLALAAEGRRLVEIFLAFCHVFCQQSHFKGK
jgi:hypothetical protein